MVRFTHPTPSTATRPARTRSPTWCSTPRSARRSRGSMRSLCVRDAQRRPTSRAGNTCPSRCSRGSSAPSSRNICFRVLPTVSGQAESGGLLLAGQCVSHFGQSEIEAKKVVHRPRLDHGPGGPTRQGRFGNSEPTGQFLLRHSQCTKRAADLVWGKQTQLATERLADLVIDVLAENLFAARLASRDLKPVDRHFVHAAVMLHFRRIGSDRRADLFQSTLGAAPRKRPLFGRVLAHDGAS